MKSNHRGSVKASRERGKSLRSSVPRPSQAEWSAGADRPDTIDLIESQNTNRLQWLLPVRRARMMSSPFAFYRGGAAIMAADLATTPSSGLRVQACGDAHLANFGLYASPERKLVFDLNDFDETLQGPWEWDLKRLVTSFEIAARHNRLDASGRREASLRVARTYRETMNEFAGWPMIDIWYALVDESDFISYADLKRTEKRGRKTIAKAKTKHSRQALDRLVEEVDDECRIKSEPPLLEPLRDLSEKVGRSDLERLAREGYEAYVSGVSSECRTLLQNYRPVEAALKVVGVGSVGTPCWILLLEGRDRNDPLFLQMKEATSSVLADHLPASPYKNQGQRVVEGQRLMQTVSDMFLGWSHTSETGRDYYWRQLRDWKGSVDIEHMGADDLNSYASLCAWTLARAHARTGDSAAISGYLGKSDRFDRALAKFADSYADQNERDYQVFVEAIRSGQLDAET